MAKSDPNIPTVNIISQDPTTGLILEAESDAAVPTTAGKFAAACEVFRLDNGLVYENTGSTASPVWTQFGTIASLANGTIFVGNGSNVATSVAVSGDATITNLGVVTVLGATGDFTSGGQIYSAQSGGSKKGLKIHDHLTTSTIVAELKAETVSTSGAFTGIWNEAHIAATGTGSVTADLNAAVVDSTFTVTGGTIIGTYGQARADGTVAGASFMAGVYGLIEASAAITASHVCSAWFDSHQANTVTGSHQLVYLTNNGAAQMDQVFYVYGGNKITDFISFDTVSGMVSDLASPITATKKVKCTLDGVDYYIYLSPVA